MLAKQISLFSCKLDDAQNLVWAMRTEATQYAYQALTILTIQQRLLVFVLRTLALQFRRGLVFNGANHVTLQSPGPMEGARASATEIATRVLAEESGRLEFAVST